MSLAAERQLLKETAMKFVQEDVDALLKQQEHKSKQLLEQQEHKSKLEGKLENALETARSILLRGMDAQFAADVTGLSLEQVQTLMDKN